MPGDGAPLGRRSRLPGGPGRRDRGTIPDPPRPGRITTTAGPAAGVAGPAAGVAGPSPAS